MQLASVRARKAKRGPFEVRRSAIHGRGVFATAAIPRGERILEYKGKRITADDAVEQYEDDEHGRHHTFLFNVDGRTIVDARRGGNESRYVNHSCEPNCFVVVERGRIYFHARRDILAGEELSYDYWYKTDDSYSQAELRRIYPCRCGARSCRGTLAAPRQTKRQ